MQKIVINGCYGGFSLSVEAAERLGLEIGEFERTYSSVSASGLKRDDARLVAVVEELGERASGSLASLYVVEVPDGVEWHIEEYDGNEHVAENHRTWS